jgi:hypothetical protein
MADPNSASTFKQGFNNYHSAKLGLYSESSREMHEILFGGISVQYIDQALGDVITDDGMPFVNDITSVVIDSSGGYSQHHLGYFPDILDAGGHQWRFGANAEFFVADGIETFDNGVIRLDQLDGQTTLGYIFGGIMTNGPHTRGVPDVTSTASYRVFEVVLIPVPEPATLLLAIIAVSAPLNSRATQTALARAGSKFGVERKVTVFKKSLLDSLTMGGAHEVC